MENEQIMRKNLNQASGHEDKNAIPTDYQFTLSEDKKNCSITIDNENYYFSKKDDVLKLIKQLEQLDNTILAGRLLIFLMNHLHKYIKPSPETETRKVYAREFLKVVLNTPRILDKIMQEHKHVLSSIIMSEDKEMIREFLKNRGLLNKIKVSVFLRCIKLCFIEDKEMLREVFTSENFIAEAQAEINNQDFIAEIRGDVRNSTKKIPANFVQTLLSDATTKTVRVFLSEISKILEAESDSDESENDEDYYEESDSEERGRSMSL